MVRIPIEPTPVTKAAPNADGGCDYEVASAGMPPRLVITDPIGTDPDDDKSPADVIVEPGTYALPSPDPIFCGTDGIGYGDGGGINCGARNCC